LISFYTFTSLFCYTSLMLTSDEEDFLRKIPDKIVRIFPFDPKATKIADELMGKIKSACPSLEIVHMGASALGISGQKDLDIYALADPKDFSKHTPKLIQLLGQPKIQRKDHVDWVFEEKGYQIEFYLTDPESPTMKKQIAVFKILQGNEKLHREYEKLKEKFNRKFYKKYQKVKYEFYHRILKPKAL